MPKSYDDITRKTVPDPIGSWQPSKEQVKQAYEGFRALDADEQALQARVQSALAGKGDITVEIERDRVTLRGRVRDAARPDADPRARARARWCRLGRRPARHRLSFFAASHAAPAISSDTLV